MRTTLVGFVGATFACVSIASTSTAGVGLFGSNTLGNESLARININTGQFQTVGKTGTANLEGLAFDLIGDILYGLDEAQEQILTIDR